MKKNFLKAIADIVAVSLIVMPIVSFIAVLIFVHLFINIGMSIGVTPITGLPLPFLSYGGSFVVSMMLALGFMQSVYRRNVLSQEEDREYNC